MAYVKFELEDGTIVYIESADAPKGSSGLIPSGKGAEHAEPAVESFDKAVHAVSKMASVIMGNLRTGFADQPAEVSVNFGLKASTDLGSLFVARGGMESNFNVSVRWHKEDKKEDAKDDKKSEETKKENSKAKAEE